MPHRENPSTYASSRRWHQLLQILATLILIAASHEKLNSAESQAATSGTGRVPNIVLILADDLGFETIGANGGTSYRTPVLDKLAARGARFTHCYSQPLCTPTRVQLMTGMSNVRNYYSFGILDPSAVTFAKVLQESGYATTMAGKWQLGKDPELPKKFGFTEHCLWTHMEPPSRYANPGLDINGEKKAYTHGEYGPDLVNDYVLDFISRKKDGPFLVYYPMFLTHDPYQPTPDSPDWDPKAFGSEVNVHQRHFGEMVAYMDKLVGKLDAHLEKLGLRENTLILFVGDNGTGRGIESKMGNETIPGGKRKTTFNGMHVPLIASWPGTIPKGTVCNDLVDSTDFFPTLLEMAGVARPEGLTLDGRSILPQLRGKEGKTREYIYSWFSPRQTGNMTVVEFAFNKRFKLYASGEFFDTSEDPFEKQPLKKDALTEKQAGALKKLEAGLAHFKHVRPKELDERYKAEAKKSSTEKAEDS